MKMNLMEKEEWMRNISIRMIEEIVKEEIRMREKKKKKERKKEGRKEREGEKKGRKILDPFFTVGNIVKNYSNKGKEGRG